MGNLPSKEAKKAVLLPIKNIMELINKSRVGLLKFPFISVQHKEQET